MENIDNKLFEKSIKILKDLIGFKTISGENNSSLINYCENILKNKEYLNFIKYLSFSDLEKYLLPNNYRLVGIDLENNNLFSGLVFFEIISFIILAAK